MRYARAAFNFFSVSALILAGVFFVQAASVQRSFLLAGIYWPTTHLCSTSCVENLIDSTEDVVLVDLVAAEVLRKIGSEAVAGLAIKHKKNLLFEKAYNASEDPYRKLGWQKSSLLNVAVYVDNEYAVSVLAKDQKFLTLQNDSGRTPLMDAVILRRTKFLPQLIPESRAPLDMADVTGERPVERALLNNFDQADVCLLMPSGGTSAINIRYLSSHGHEAAWWRSKIDDLNCGDVPPAKKYPTN